MRAFTVLCGIALGLLQLGAVGTAEARQPAVKQTYTTEASYQQGSPEVREIQRWLRQHSAYDVEALDKTGKPGTVHVTYTATSTSLRPMNPEPPMPLPPAGNTGDRITINHTSGGYERSWTFEWRPDSAGGRWVQTDFEEHEVPTHPE